MNRLVYCTVFYLFVSLCSVHTYPLIHNFDQEDKVFALFTQKRATNNVGSIFEYRLKKDETLLSISKKYNLSISTLITLNRSNAIHQLGEQDYILVTPYKGLFITINPNTDLEFLIKNRIYPSLEKQLPIVIKSQFASISDTFYFSPDTVLTKFEYQLWITQEFRVPVLQGYVSSYFGTRISPISGKRIHHNGIDIASKSASHIFSISDGVIIKDGYNSIFGYFIVISHKNNIDTLYGHLLESTVQVGDSVRVGQLIGYMGNTGMSTGAHVHVEIYKENRVVNPLNYLNF